MTAARKQAHTVGPWTYEAGTRGARIHVANDFNHRLSFGFRYAEADFAEAEANARLIAAAPEMLTELQATERLALEMASVIYNDAIERHVPFGLRERVEAWVRNHGAAIAKAVGADTGEAADVR